jgi:hypothetical protein
VIPFALSVNGEGQVGGAIQRIVASQPALSTLPSDVNTTVKHPETEVAKNGPGIVVPVKVPKSGADVLSPS